MIGFVFNKIGAQCVGYGDALGLSLSVNDATKSVKFISNNAIHTTEYSFQLTKDDQKFVSIPSSYLP